MDHGELDRALKFANVTRPVVSIQNRFRFWRDRVDVLAQFGIADFDEMIQQRGDVFATLAESRQADRETVEAIEQVLSEFVLGHHRDEVLIGSGDDADVGLDRRVAADALELLLLEQSQCLGLSCGAHVADLVEEDRAAVDLLELADVTLIRAGEGSFFVTEEFAFEQRFGQRRTVDGKKRFLAALAVVIDGSRDQFFAGAAFAEDQHRGVLRGDSADRKRSEASPAPVPVVPDPPPSVLPGRLHVPALLDVTRYDPAAAGSAFLWDDFAAGERIDHVDGMTIEESCHMTATRFYQNNAKVHFNQFSEASGRYGRRIVYGGHVMSIARALSCNGLANAFRIAAINGGRHANPCFAGDTIHAWSAIAEKWQLPGRRDLGGLRLRTVATRDRPCHDFPDKGPDGAADPAVVLDLDYTVFMPRRMG